MAAPLLPTRFWLLADTLTLRILPLPLDFPFPVPILWLPFLSSFFFDSLRVAAVMFRTMILGFRGGALLELVKLLIWQCKAVQARVKARTGRRSGPVRRWH